METEKEFKTKTGFCHVTTDKIFLTRDGVIGNISKVTVGNNLARFLIIYGIISIGLLYFAYRNYLRGYTLTSTFLGVIGLYLSYGIVKSRNNSATPIIERKDITRVTYNAGVAGLTRPRFEVEFNESGKLKKRLIMLPGTLAGGQREAEKAVQLMRDEKLLR